MQEVRYNYLLGEWVLLSTERKERPFQFSLNHKESNQNSKEFCPFCLENKHMTSNEVYISKNKKVRIIPNKYPAIDESDDENFGIHEVLIDTPNHFEKLHSFSISDITEVLVSIKERICFLSQLKQIKYIQVFKNEGVKSGASIFHSHCQIIALPFIPSRQQTIIKNLKKYQKKNNSCFVCDEIKKNVNNIICENEDFLIYMPNAALYAYSVDIVPKKHIENFIDFDENMLKKFSIMLKMILNCYIKLFDDFNYNICFYNSPCKKIKEYHFFMQIIPRISNIAGFEFSTGCFINSILPIEAVATFKNILKTYNNFEGENIL